MRTLIVLSGLLFLFGSCGDQQKQAVKSDEEVLEIAKRTYIYGYPLVLMDLTQKLSTNYLEPTDFATAPVNQFGHYRRFPDDKFTGVVKANVDTYYSSAWLDLKQGPVVMKVPATDRYYLLPMLDAYSNVFSVPGPRTTGTDVRTFLIAGPFWKGETPQGMTLIQAPTNMVWILGRTQVNSPQDGATVVKKIQGGYQLIPLSEFGKEYKAPMGKVTEEYKNIVPVRDAEAMPIDEFFTTLAKLMVDNPPAPADSVIVREMASIGIVPGEKFNSDVLSKELFEKLSAIPQAVDQSFKETVTSRDPKLLINGWNTTYTLKEMGNYGTNYPLRALVAYIGLGANLREDAVYPNTAFDGDGNLLNASHRYIMHFNKNEIPPVRAFWSITVYDNRNFLAANPINRFALGDRDKLSYNPDGSLDIYIQKENPGGKKMSNWLPTPQEGNFELTMRLYWPKDEVLQGTWKPVPVKKVE